MMAEFHQFQGPGVVHMLAHYYTVMAYWDNIMLPLLKSYQ